MLGGVKILVRIFGRGSATRAALAAATPFLRHDKAELTGDAGVGDCKVRRHHEALLASVIGDW
jgi:hypothetical protein